MILRSGSAAVLLIIFIVHPVMSHFSLLTFFNNVVLVWKDILGKLMNYRRLASFVFSEDKVTYD